MKNKLSLILTISGIILVPLVFFHWLFIIAAIFAFISAILFKK